MEHSVSISSHVTSSHWFTEDVYAVEVPTAGPVQAIGVVFTEYLYPEAQARGEEGFRLETALEGNLELYDTTHASLLQ
jgi:hypothetical protein